MRQTTDNGQQVNENGHRTTVGTLLRHGLLLTVACSLFAGCNEISAPLRGDIYGRSIIVSDVVAQDTVIDGVSYEMGQVVTDTVDFAWRAGDLPIKIWVHDTAGLPDDVRDAVAAWQQVLIFGELAVQYVSDSTQAQIIVRGSNPLPPPEAPAGVTGIRFHSAPMACEGGTDIYVSAPDHTKLWTPIRVYVIPKYLLSDPETQACLARVTIHELGHALGLFRHSPNTDDIMYALPSVDAPSEVDAATVQFLYHQTPDLRPALGRDSLSVPLVTH
jgi:hypothetical protein